MVPEDIFRWYEANLPLKERKVRGHFSTPPPLVERILDACGYCPEADLSQIRVLDPACGSGNFLAGVARRLVASESCLNLSRAALLSTAQRNIWGFDPDPVACFLAEMQLRTILMNEPVVDENTEQAMPSAATKEGGLSLHVHQADGLAFPWDEYEGIDLFLANPPYLAAKNSDLSCYRFAHRRGQADSYLLFLDLALRVVRPGGWIGLVLPDPVLARINAAQERRRLLKETTVHALWHLSGVFSACVGAVVIVAQKSCPSSLHQVHWSREKWVVGAGSLRAGASRVLLGSRPTLASLRTGAETLQIGALRAGASHVLPGSRPTLPRSIGEPQHLTSLRSAARKVLTDQSQFIPQALLLQQSGAELRYLLSEVRGTLLERLHTLRYEALEADKRRNFGKLSDLVAVRRGEELGKEHPLLLRTEPADGQDWHCVLLGGIEVRPYTVPVGHCWIARDKIVKPLERYLAPKLLVVKSTGYLQATLDLQGHVVLQTLYLLNLYPGGTEDDLYFLLALLNSRLLREYIYVLYTAYKWVQPQIEQHVLAHLPVPLIDSSERRQIISQAKLLMHACSEQSSVVEFEEQYKAMYEEQERAICALYTHALS